MATISQIIIRLIASIFSGIGLACIIFDYLKIPTNKTYKARANIINAGKGESNLNLWFESLAKFISKHLRINDFKKQELKVDLRTAQLDISPEMFIANAIVKSLMFAVLAIPFFFIAPIVGILVLGASVILFFLSSNIKGRIEEKRKNIEADLPRLVATIQKKLSYDRSIMAILNDFLPVACPDFKREIEITIADINSGNEEAAITRLEARVGSPLMSDVCRGFITMIHGDVAEVYWSSLGIKFSDLRRQRLKDKALKIPKKANKLSIAILVAFIATFFVVIISQIMGSMNVFF